MPWNDHGIQTGHAAPLFQSCRSLALMDLLLISKLQAFHCCNKNGQPNRALSRVQSHPCRFWRIVVASQLLEWSKLGDLFLKKWWLIYFCKCYYFFNYLVNIFFIKNLVNSCLINRMEQRCRTCSSPTQVRKQDRTTHGGPLSWEESHFIRNGLNLAGIWNNRMKTNQRKDESCI